MAYTDMAVGPGHPFYVRLNEILDGEGFDAFVEKLCARFYAEKLGRPGLTPGIYFRSLMIGYFEGIESERGIAWRLKDTLSLRRFVGIALEEDTPDHSTIFPCPSIDRCGDTSAGIFLGARPACRSGIASGQANWN